MLPASCGELSERTTSGRLRRTGWSRAPALNWRSGFKTVEAQVGGGQHFGEHDDLAGVHRNGKRSTNRFLIFCLQAL